MPLAPWHLACCMHAHVAVRLGLMQRPRERQRAVEHGLAPPVDPSARHHLLGRLGCAGAATVQCFVSWLGLTSDVRVEGPRAGRT